MPRITRLDPAFTPADAFIGIVTNMPVIQLVHFINTRTLLDLIRVEDLPVYSDKTNSLSSFKFFHYQDDDYRSDFCLICNNNGTINLLPTHKEFGYFMVVQGAIPAEKVKQLIALIKPIAGVQVAALIKQETIRPLGHLLQDIELHLTELKTKKAETPKRIMPLSEDQ